MRPEFRSAAGDRTVSLLEDEILSMDLVDLTLAAMFIIFVLFVPWFFLFS